MYALGTVFKLDERLVSAWIQKVFVPHAGKGIVASPNSLYSVHRA
jgi:hypothetical protein